MKYLLTHPLVALAGLWTLAKIGAVYVVTLTRRAARQAKGGAR